MALLVRTALRASQPLRVASCGVQTRGFADKMAFTFASPYEVSERDCPLALLANQRLMPMF